MSPVSEVIPPTLGRPDDAGLPELLAAVIGSHLRSMPAPMVGDAGCVRGEEAGQMVKISGQVERGSSPTVLMKDEKPGWFCCKWVSQSPNSPSASGWMPAMASADNLNARGVARRRFSAMNLRWRPASTCCTCLVNMCKVAD